MTAWVDGCLSLSLDVPVAAVSRGCLVYLRWNLRVIFIPPSPSPPTSVSLIFCPKYGPSFFAPLQALHFCSSLNILLLSEQFQEPCQWRPHHQTPPPRSCPKELTRRLPGHLPRFHSALLLYFTLLLRCVLYCSRTKLLVVPFSLLPPCLCPRFCSDWTSTL